MKKYIYKVYDSSENFISEWTKDVISDIRFTREINNPTSELVIKLGRDVTNYGEGDDVDFNNIIKIYVEDYEVTGDLDPFFIGYIANYTPIFNDNDSYIEVSVFPFDSTLNNLIHGADETADQTQTDTDDTITFGLSTPIAQSFIPTVSPITSIDVYLATPSPQNATMTIESDNSGKPSGSVVTNGTVTKYISDSSTARQRFIFSDGAEVTTSPATTYWAVIKGEA